MLQASCIYLGLNSPCPETYHPLHPPRRLNRPLPSCKCYLNRGILKSLLIDVSLIASTNLPIRMKPPWSLSALSLVIRPTVTPPCLNKGNLLLLRSSFLFCLAGTMPYRSPCIFIYAPCELFTINLIRRWLKHGWGRKKCWGAACINKLLLQDQESELSPTTNKAASKARKGKVFILSTAKMEFYTYSHLFFWLSGAPWSFSWSPECSP